MKRYLPLGLILFLLLTSCVPNFYNAGLNLNLSQESWMREVETSPALWARGASGFFLRGQSMPLEKKQVPSGETVSTLSVQAPYFTNIEIKGNFKVQLYGTNGPNRVAVYGPYVGVHEVIVEVKGNTLCISQVKDARNTRGVIVHIGVNQLRRLINQGASTIEGIQLRSSRLFIESNGSGNIYLAGNLNVRGIFNAGSGCINVFGANTPLLKIKSIGSGTVNVCGNVGIDVILHHGCGNINIIGANSAHLLIDADGSGKIGISGIVDLRAIRAQDHIRVFATGVRSRALYAYVHDGAQIGLAGSAEHLFVNSFQSSCFLAKNLCVMDIFAKAHHNSHLNLSACNKIFVSTTENGSIYFFGPPGILNQFSTGNSIVIPVKSANGCCFVPQPVYKVKRISYKGEI